MIRVIFAEDHHLVRQGIKALLEKMSNIDVVGEAENGQQAIELVQHLAPDVALLDVAMPHLNGIQVLAQIRALNIPTRVVILSMHTDTLLVRQALLQGASGYLLKQAVTEELWWAIYTAHRKGIYLSSALNVNVADLLATPSLVPQTPFEQLSPREWELLHLIAEGHTNNEMAHILHLSVKTIEKHRASLMAKLNVHDVAGLIKKAIKYGAILLDE